MILRILSLAVLAVSVSACVTVVQSDVAEGPFYNQGYNDGCQTGREASKSFSQKTYQDDSLFKSDASYRSGWRQGYASCNMRQNEGLDVDHNGSDF